MLWSKGIFIKTYVKKFILSEKQFGFFLFKKNLFSPTKSLKYLNYVDILKKSMKHIRFNYRNFLIHTHMMIQ